MAKPREDEKRMGIIVKFFASFREAVGRGQEDIEGVKDVASLLDELVHRFGEKLAEHLYHSGTRELRKTVNILVNGRGLNLPYELDTPLKDGDVVAIFPPVSGG
jgi:molybdopterin synthase sulfur carrier subunit